MRNCHAYDLTAMAGRLLGIGEDKVSEKKTLSEAELPRWQMQDHVHISQQCKRTVYTVNITAYESEQRAKLYSAHLHQKWTEKERHSTRGEVRKSAAENNHC